MALLAGAASAGAQTAGLLYDPEPPANSAYVRVINAVPHAAIEVSVDGRARVPRLASGEASDYLVLPAGKRDLAVRAVAGGSAVSVRIDVAAGRALSVAFNSLAGDAAPWTFQDKANTNKLKAVLAVYHLGTGGALDVYTGDGATKVVSGLRPGTSFGLLVNPVKVELIVAAAGTTAPVARAMLSMAPGGTYSVLVFTGLAGGPAARAFQNKAERYTGK